MNVVKNILGRLLATWAMIMFVITMLIFAIPIWIISRQHDPRRSILFHKTSAVWMRIFFFLSGIRLNIKGKEKFRANENYIVISNHNSLMDVPLTTPFIPGANKTIAKIEMARIPLFGMIYRTGSVLVDRKNEESRKNSFSDMKDVLKMGLHMCIYPEGTRNKTGEPMQQFQSGAFRLAVDTGKSIMPAVLFNTAKVLPANKKFFFWPVTVKMHFLDPIQPDSMTFDELKNKAFAVMREYYISHRDQ
jgi:1-acyl-sn-glycerol-3-phosphate acyltransferase